MKTKLETITPEIAARLLQKNNSNRPISVRAIQRIAKEIEEGRWVTTHQGICIAEDGEIIDGQHRLKAIIMAEKTVEIMVTRGAKKETFKYIDTGKKRNPQDIYAIEGYKYYSYHPGLAARCLIWTNKERLTRKESLYDIDTLLEFTRANVDELQDAMIVALNTKQQVYNKNIAIFMAWLFNKTDHCFTENYLVPLLSGITTNPYLIKLREELIDLKIRRLTIEDHALVCKTLHAVLCSLEKKNKRMPDIQKKTPYELYDQIISFQYRKK